MANPENSNSSRTEANALRERFGSKLFRLGIAVALLVFILDQLTKWVARGVFEYPGQVIPVFPGFNLTLVFNPGVSWGALGWVGPWALSALALAIAVGLLFWLRKAETHLIAVALGLVVGGAVGNVVDRITIGAVVDFLDFYLPGTDWPHWPAFNIADSGIVVGVGLIIIDGLFAGRGENA